METGVGLGEMLGEIKVSDSALVYAVSSQWRLGFNPEVEVLQAMERVAWIPRLSVRTINSMHVSF